jgi:hypothetical protein
MAGGKIVEDANVVPEREQAFDDVRADKARPPGYENLHRVFSYPSP